MKKILLKLLRFFVGKSILFFDFLVPTGSISREETDKSRVDSLTQNLTLYEFRACPFCVKVRRKIRYLQLNIQTKDAKRDPIARQELSDNGGKIKVPCLRISKDDPQDTWMYESSDIIRYLEEHFGKKDSQQTS
ncbi:hypothetical protein AB834_03395 [PVC group bacterium (ex Bugula neritina AB1)]|nr:hypothetical protein AB834_03395 [PVC group bacterium (ex Bugula neritina AB1)]